MLNNYYFFCKRDHIILLSLFLGILVLPAFFSVFYETFFNSNHDDLLIIALGEEKDCDHINDKRIQLHKTFISEQQQDHIIEFIINNNIRCVALTTDKDSETKIIFKLKKNYKLINIH